MRVSMVRGIMTMRVAMIVSVRHDGKQKSECTEQGIMHVLQHSIRELCLGSSWKRL